MVLLHLSHLLVLKDLEYLVVLWDLKDLLVLWDQLNLLHLGHLLVPPPGVRFGFEKPIRHHPITFFHSRIATDWKRPAFV
jgi:hypothetical protein